MPFLDEKDNSPDLIEKLKGLILKEDQERAQEEQRINVLKEEERIRNLKLKQIMDVLKEARLNAITTISNFEDLAAHFNTRTGNKKLLTFTTQLPNLKGWVCRPMAVVNLLNYYKEKNVISCQLPPFRKKADGKTLGFNTEAKASTDISIRAILKKTSGSKVGELYTENMYKEFIKGLGKQISNSQIENAEIEFKRFNISSDEKDVMASKTDSKQEYINFIKAEVDNDRPPIIFYNACLGGKKLGQPLLDTEELNEHSALVVGYLYKENKLSFVLCHWSWFTIVDANELAMSAANLIECRTTPETYYKIRSDGHTTRWTPVLDCYKYSYSDVYDEIDAASKKVKLKDIASNGDEAESFTRHGGSQIMLFKRKGCQVTGNRPAFRSAVCTIKLK